jgi:hypothetical protein
MTDRAGGREAARICLRPAERNHLARDGENGRRRQRRCGERPIGTILRGYKIVHDVTIPTLMLRVHLRGVAGLPVCSGGFPLNSRRNPREINPALETVPRPTGAGLAASRNLGPFRLRMLAQVASISPALSTTTNPEYVLIEGGDVYG